MPTLFDPDTTALVLIDLQQGIVGRTLHPRSAADVVKSAASLAAAFRAKSSPVVLVNVNFRDQHDRLYAPADAPMPAAPLPPNWADLVPELNVQPSDICITKRQWGAFFGTELDLQLRRRHIRTIVLAGIATNFGVESTARDAYERGYDQVFAEDAMATFSVEAHKFPIENIFPRIGRVRSTAAILQEFTP